MASILKRIGDFDINQDLAFQRRSWSLQRIGWGLSALVLIAALLGLFGHGPLSEATTDDPSLPIRLAYERFGRFGSPLVLRIRVEPAAAPDGRLSLWLSQGYLEGVHIQRITPHPIAQHLSAGGVFYHFQLTQPVESSEVAFHVEAQEVGLLSGRIGLTEARAALPTMDLSVVP